MGIILLIYEWNTSTYMYLVQRHTLIVLFLASFTLNIWSSTGVWVTASPLWFPEPFWVFLVNINIAMICMVLILLFVSNSSSSLTKPQGTLPIIILLIFEFFTAALPMVSHWSLNDSKSLQVSRNLHSILADHNNVVVWMVSVIIIIFTP